MARINGNKAGKSSDGKPGNVGKISEPIDRAGSAEGEPGTGSAAAGGNPSVIDPAEIGGTGGGDNRPGDGGKRPRGRPRGSGSRPRSSGPLDVKQREQFSTFLFQTHALIAGAVSPFLKIDKTEADQLAGAVADVAELYDIPAVSPEVIAWGNLIQTVGFIYGTRIMAARFAARQEKTQTRADASNSRGSTTPAANAPKPEAAPAARPGLEPIYIDDPILGRIQAGGYAPPPPPPSAP